MAANNLGTAYIKIAPQMEGIQGAITRGLQSAVKSSTASATALGTAISMGVSKSISAVTNSLDYAIKRVDTLAVFPKIMKNLGFEADESESAVSKLSSRIEGLPTTLDEIVTYTQRLASSTGNLNKGMKNATSIAIAFNDAALAGGKGQEEANRAFEQFVQVVSRGRPTMQDWKIMLEVMPGQLKQMAKYMGENNDSLKEYAKQAGKTADQLDGMDLYEWISADKNAYAKERLDEFTTALVELDEKGGNGITSFKDQVGDATKTIGNAMRLIPIRIGKALGEVVAAFGQGDIYDAVDKFTSSFSDIGKWIAQNIVPVVKNNLIPVFKEILKVIKGVVEFIAQNKWVQTFLLGILQTMLAFKAISIVKSAITGIITPVIDLAKNMGSAASAFKAAHAAGLTFSTSMGAAASASTGLTSSVTGVIAKVGSLSGVILPALGVAAGVAAGAIIGLKMENIAYETKVAEAKTKIREYCRAHYDLAQATKSAARAQEILKDAINDLKTAEAAANNAEIAALEYKKQAAEYQEEMNNLKKEGKENTDEYRLAELKYNQAILQQAEAEKELKTAQDQVAASKVEIDDLNSSGLYKANLVLATLMREGEEYGTLAAKLDELKNATIQYKDENGNMVTATKEKVAEMVEGLSEQLANSSTKTGAIWRNIVDIANREGISFAEAAAKYGEMAGEELPGNFSEGLRYNVPLITEATKEAGEKAVEQMKASTKEGYQVGKDFTQGVADGSQDGGVVKGWFARLVAMIKAAIAKMKAAADEHSPSKKTAEIGKFMALGLSKGIDDYADDAVESAQEAAERTLSAFNGDMALNGSASGIQPYNALTSGMSGSGAVTQYNTFNQVDSNLDMQEISKRLGWQVATAI